MFVCLFVVVLFGRWKITDRTECSLVTVLNNRGFIALPYWGTMLPLPWHNIPLSQNYYVNQPIVYLVKPTTILDLTRPELGLKNLSHEK